VAYYTTSTAFLEALAEAGVRYVFANLGSDHPGIIEAFAQARADGRADALPRLIVCPHEVVAISAAHSYAMITGEAQAVVVHVDSGTANVVGSVGNALRGRVPVLVFAGAVPATQEGELPGGRTEFIQWIQDVRDQRGILRNYVKYDQEIRSGRNVKQLVHRALQLARSEPAGPVYLTATREVMEERLEPYRVDPAGFGAVAPGALTRDVVEEVAGALAGAQRPLIVTSYLGRDPAAVPSLEALAGLLAIPVIEAMAYHVNFPFDNPLHAGFQYHSVGQNPVLAEADVILVLDSDVPWIPAINKPSPDASVYYIDVDPVKPAIMTWYTPAKRLAAASTKVAVEQIASQVREHILTDGAPGAADLLARIERRREQAAGRHARMVAALDEAEQPTGDLITAEYLSACVRKLLEGTGALVLTEVVTASRTATEGLRPAVPGSVIHHGGGYLGWSTGAALGAALAVGPSRPVVSLVGDGSFLFSSPAAAYWAQRRYSAPSLTVIYDNRGWAGPKFSTRHVYPDGAAVAADDFNASFDPEVDLPAVAVAAGAGFGATVSVPADLPGVLKDALEVVLGGRSAVVSVHITPVQQS